MASPPAQLPTQDSAQPVVILYSYDESPFARKTMMLLTIRKIPFHIVPVARIPPRPELQLLGIDYRRIPVLAINDTVYCDTFMIVQALEDLHPDSEAHPSLYPKNQSTGKQEHVALQKLLIHFWADRALFGIAAGLLPWKMFPKEFVEDRSAYRATSIDPEKLEALKPYTTSQIKLHLELVEQQLAENDTAYLFDTAYPGYLDISVYFILNWLQQVGQEETLLGGNEFPAVLKWMERVGRYFKSLEVKKTKITSQEANQLIGSVSGPPSLSSTSEGRLFGLGTQVSVVPDDTGKIPTQGTLVGIDRERILLDVQRRDGSDRTCRVCFPRLGFLIVPLDPNAKDTGVGKI